MTFIDFFAGIGGFRKGMEMAGHKCVGHCEIDKYADMSYRSMHTITEKQREKLLTMPFKERQKEIRKEEYLNGEWYADDITRVDPGDVPNADCYCFGFPCQSFSIAGHRRGFDDIRGTLFFEVMRIAKERKPDVLFAENVAGLLNHEGGSHLGSSSTPFKNWGTAWNGKCVTANIMSPKTEREFSLSDILEEEVDQKYFLSEHTVKRLMGYKDTEYKGLMAQEDTSKTECTEQRGVAPALCQGKSDLNIVVNTLVAGDRNSVGTYIATDRQTDRQTGILKVNGFHKE